jgi:hypothetical protein
MIKEMFPGHFLLLPFLCQFPRDIFYTTMDSQHCGHRTRFFRLFGTIWNRLWAMPCKVIPSFQYPNKHAAFSRLVSFQFPRLRRSQKALILMIHLICFGIVKTKRPSSTMTCQSSQNLSRHVTALLSFNTEFPLKTIQSSTT